MSTVFLNAKYYEQFDADYSRDVPAEGYNGWKSARLPFSLQHSALVVMHAWDCGTPEQYPGWYRCVEYIPRANQIVAEIFPPLLKAVRKSGLRVIHVVSDAGYYRELPGYKETQKIAGSPPAPLETVSADPVHAELNKFRSANIIGAHNLADVGRGFGRLDFPAPARPLDNELVAEDGRQLFAVCKHHGVNHLVYVGFAINWCLLMSPGGMLDMKRHGVLCSTIRQAVTAVERKESARHELEKQSALWRVALNFGFVYDLEDFVGALKQ